MIGLHIAGSDDRIGTPFHGISKKKFQLPQLVSAKPEAGEVIPLHKNPRASDFLSQCRKLLQRSRQVCQFDSCQLFISHF